MKLSAYLMRLRGQVGAWEVRQVAPAGEKRIRTEYVLALALLLILGVVLYQTTLKYRQTEEWDVRMDVALGDLDSISSLLRDAEAGERGYLLTGDEQYLKSYRVASQTIERDLSDLRPLIADNPSFEQKVDTLAALVPQELAVMGQIYELREHQGFEPAARMALLRQDQQNMDDIVQLITDVEDEQNQLLQQKTDEADIRNQTINVSITFGSFLAIMLAAFMISRAIAERKYTDAALRESTARFHRLAENALDMIYRYRLAPVPGFEYVNPAATLITGYTPHDFYADPYWVYKLVYPEDRPLMEVLTYPSSTTASLTVRWVHQNGSLIWTNQQLVPVYDRAGNLVAIEGIVRDITERMQAYQMLERRVEERTHEIERRRRVAEGLRDILTILNSNRPLEAILDAIIAQASQLLGIDAGAVYHLREHEGLLSIQVAYGLDTGDVALPIPVGWGAVGEAILNRQPVVAAHAHADLAEAHDPALAPQFLARLTALFSRYGAVLVVPLIIKDDIYGALAFYYREPREFTPEEIELAVAFGDQAALAIENARLRMQAERSAVAAERSRLARDLHDAVTQTLFSTSLIADVLPRLWERDQSEARLRLEELRQLTRGAMAEMRGLLLELRPATLVEAELGELLRQLVEALAGRARVHVSLAIDGQRRLPANVQIAIYRVAQEALNNVARHAEASQVTVSLCHRADAIELCISDDGRGFDPSTVASQHFGLSIMRERAEAIGAILWIDSQPGLGTQVAITWPLGGVVDGGSHERE